MLRLPRSRPGDIALAFLRRGNLFFAITRLGPKKCAVPGEMGFGKRGELIELSVSL